MGRWDVPAGIPADKRKKTGESAIDYPSAVWAKQLGQGAVALSKETAIDYLTRFDWRESRLGLERMEVLLGQLGNPQQKVPMVHIAGTNGKSSTSAMLAAVLAAAGYKTGLYTSPYVNRFNERMQINGCPIDDEALAEVTARVAAVADTMENHPTEFELVTAVAFEWFYGQHCDVVVLEVGLGGRLDATNIIQKPELAVITTIDLDHTEILGDTLEKIAAEKAGIIKPGCDVVLYPQTPEVRAVFTAACSAANARLVDVELDGLAITSQTLDGQCFNYAGMENLTLPLLGLYQVNNAATVVTAARCLAARGWNIPEKALQAGLAGVYWPARFELLGRRPAFVLDGGHNPQGAQKVVEALHHYFPGKRVIFIVGVMADKDYREMFRQIAPLAEHVLCVAPAVPRALPADKLAEEFTQLSVTAVACADEAHAVEKALLMAGDAGVVCAFGTFYMALGIRNAWQNYYGDGKTI